MTVVIEDLNKPKDCWQCRDNFCVWDEEHGKYYCAVNGDWINFEDGSVNLDCPLEDYKGPAWIPVSERLPENMETVIVTHRSGVSFAWHNGRYWERGASTDHRPIKTVTAWMPLPEPYKEGKDASVE